MSLVLSNITVNRPHIEDPLSIPTVHLEINLPFSLKRTSDYPSKQPKAHLTPIRLKLISQLETQTITTVNSQLKSISLVSNATNGYEHY